MSILNKHIFLIGFKHVGKSFIGKALAKQLNEKFIDLDQEIEILQKMKCRQIMQEQGEVFFRELENLALAQIVQQKPAIIALGGGTPLLEKNQELLRRHLIIQITASPEVVFERIMRNGRPAFFSDTEDPWLTFNNLWNERDKIYQELMDFSVENNKTVEMTVAKIVEKL
jgi:shikimate kinase